MYYGNAQITRDTETPAGVFDAGYVGVWHLGRDGQRGGQRVSRQQRLRQPRSRGQGRGRGRSRARRRADRLRAELQQRRRHLQLRRRRQRRLAQHQRASHDDAGLGAPQRRDQRRARHAPGEQRPLRHPGPQGMGYRVQLLAAGRGYRVPRQRGEPLRRLEHARALRARPVDKHGGGARARRVAPRGDDLQRRHAEHLCGRRAAGVPGEDREHPAFGSRAQRLHRPRRPAGERGLERPVRGRHRRGAHLQRDALRQLAAQRVPQPVGAGRLLRGRWRDGCGRLARDLRREPALDRELRPTTSRAR